MSKITDMMGGARRTKKFRAGDDGQRSRSQEVEGEEREGAMGGIVADVVYMNANTCPSSVQPIGDKWYTVQLELPFWILTMLEHSTIKYAKLG